MPDELPDWERLLAAERHLQASGWEAERAQRPVIILGRLDGVMTGLRLSGDP